MKRKHFYSHLVKTETIAVRLSYLDMSDEERAHLLGLIDSSLHHAILDAVLSELSEQDKKKFLEHLGTGKHDRLWEFLNGKVDNIEEKIKKTADDLSDAIHKDIDEAKKKHGA